MLVTAGATVFHALRHGIFLHPDNVVTEIPAVVPEGKSRHPRNTDQVFWLDFFLAPPGIGVTEVEPQRTVRAQNAPDFRKNFRQARYIFLWGGFPADLTVHPVVPQGVVGRRGHAAVYTPVRQAPKHIKGIAGINGIKLYGHQLLSGRVELPQLGSSTVVMG